LKTMRNKRALNSIRTFSYERCRSLARTISAASSNNELRVKVNVFLCFISWATRIEILWWLEL
jgi:hypothetical protein